MEGVLHLDLTIHEETYEQGAQTLLRSLRPEWKPEDVTFKVFTEGFSNKLFMCSTPSGNKTDAVVVRIYGKNSELFTDRDAEICNMLVMNQFRSGADVYARFNNGIAYGFVPGRCFDMDTVRDPYMASLVAKEMVHMHAITKEDIHRHDIPIETQPWLFRNMKAFIGMIPESLPDETMNRRLQTDIPSPDELLKEATMLERHLNQLNSPVVFCHNDILQKNILYNEELDRVFFIDFEYAGFNYEAFELGDHFCEWAGTVDDINYDLYPDREVQLPWLRKYLEHKAEVEGRREEVTDKEVNRYYVMANKFALAAHFLWAVWGVIQAKYSTIDFDYFNYAKIRFDEYYAKKDLFLGLQLPR